MTSPESDVPEFLTGDIREDIVYFSYDEKTQEVYAPHAEKPQNIGNFCLKEDYYYIPLFLLINNRKGDSSNETRLKNILKDIVTRVVRYRIEKEFDILTTESQKQEFVNKYIEDDYKGEIIKARKWIEVNLKKAGSVWEKPIGLIR